MEHEVIKKEIENLSRPGKAGDFRAKNKYLKFLFFFLTVGLTEDRL